MRLPKMVGDLARAERFQALLDAGEARNRADLAHRFRLTRARVTPLMDLLLLHPMILAYVKSLPPGTPTRLVTERALRPIVRTTISKQVAAAARMVAGFQTFMNGNVRSA